MVWNGTKPGLSSINQLDYQGIFELCRMSWHVYGCVYPQVLLWALDRWSGEGSGVLLSWTAVWLLHQKGPPLQISFPYMWWSGSGWDTTSPSSSNSADTLHECIPTTKVSVTLNINQFSINPAGERLEVMLPLDFYEFGFYVLCLWSSLWCVYDFIILMSNRAARFGGEKNPIAFFLIKM